MGKAVFTSFMILCSFLILFSLECNISVKAYPDIIHVPTAYPTIQVAIDYANPGDTIFVENGVYYENIVIHKSISLVGEDQDSTIISGNKTGNVIRIIANEVNIQGFTLEESGSQDARARAGIFIDHSSGNDIRYNTIADNYEGISFDYSSNNMISRNNILNNYYAISLSHSSNNMISCNTITDNYEGTRFHYSSYNIISCNTITDNEYGLYLTLFSSGNSIFLNNFNNSNQVWIAQTLENFWDNGNEGNYWSNYTGQDANKDGVGEEPYIINQDNQDNYPLMGMFSDFTVSSLRETYHITSICNSTITEFGFRIGLETGNRIVSFNTTSRNNEAVFCRIMIPIALMDSPFIVLVDAEELTPMLLNISNETHTCLYFTYDQKNHVITIISSKSLYLYSELLDDYIQLQLDIYDLNTTYYDLLDDYNTLLDNCSHLQTSYNELNSSSQKHLSNYSENAHNIQNLMYVFAATTIVFIITTMYLSRIAHTSNLEVFKDAKKSPS